MEQSININPSNISTMAVVSTNLSDQLLNRQVMELRDPDSMPNPEPEPARDSENNVADEDHRGGDDWNDGSEDEDDLLLAPMTSTQLICIMCGTRVASTERLRRHTVKHHSEASEMFEFLIETAVEIFPAIYAKTQAQTSNPTTSKVNSVHGKKYEFHSDHGQRDPETSTSARLREKSYNICSSVVSTKLLNEATAPKSNQNSGNCAGQEKPFKCEYCGAGWTYKSQYDIHLRSHTGERPYICQDCGKEFKQMGQLNYHMKIHTGEKPFICQECGMRCAFQYTLKRHMRTHSGEKPFVCQQCNLGLSSAQVLRQHTLLHTGELPFMCRHCNRRFRQMTQLKEHLATHSGERAYPCPQCEKVFGFKVTLARHLRTHSGERPFPCTLCAKRFYHKWTLADHLRTHSGDRPYVCDQCPEAFTSSGGRYQHRKRHTGRKPLLK